MYKRAINTILRTGPGRLSRRVVDTARAANNRRHIINIARQNRPIFLEPSPLRKRGGGHIEHYFHFIFDLVLPLYDILSRSHSNTMMVLKPFGIFTERLEQFFPNRVRIEANIDSFPKIQRCRLLGMNPNWIFLNPNLVQRFKDDIFQALDIVPCYEPSRILVIERLPPVPYFLTKAEIKGGGTQRRSIVNHEELALALDGMADRPYSVQSLALETMTQREQVRYFDEAALVIAQHGASLANTLWMKPESTVIEISDNPSRNFFQRICKCKKHEHFLYRTDNPHTTIDLEHFSTWITGNASLKRFFRV